MSMCGLISIAAPCPEIKVHYTCVHNLLTDF